MMLMGLGGAAAQEPQAPAVETTGTAIVTTLGGHKVTIPLPRWLAAGTAAEAPFVFNQIEPGVESLTFVPEGDSIVAWTETMGVLVVNRPGYSAEAHVRSIIDPMTTSCSSGQLGMTPVKAPRAGLADALILACGRYSLTSRTAPNGCAGGILVAVVRESWVGAMKVYDEWCTGGFNLDDRSTWPVTFEELVEVAIDMQTITQFEPLPG